MSIRKGIYQHYKGPLYRVTDVARHSETEEELVVYQTLYGYRGVWVRPLSMFTELVDVDGIEMPRFAYYEEQKEVLEVAVLDVKKGMQIDFEDAFQQAQTIISSMPGYISHELKSCVERSGRYLLLVTWQTLEDHTTGFRQSPEYEEWRTLLHHFYEPFPTVEHYL